MTLAPPRLQNPKVRHLSNINKGKRNNPRNFKAPNEREIKPLILSLKDLSRHCEERFNRLNKNSPESSVELQWIQEACELYFYKSCSELKPHFNNRKFQKPHFQNKKFNTYNQNRIVTPESHEKFVNDRALPRLAKNPNLTSKSFEQVRKAVNWVLSWDPKRVFCNWPKIGTKMEWKEIFFPTEVKTTDKDLDSRKLIFNGLVCAQLVDFKVAENLNPSENLTSQNPEELKKLWTDVGSGFEKYSISQLKSFTELFFQSMLPLKEHLESFPKDVKFNSVLSSAEKELRQLTQKINALSKVESASKALTKIGEIKRGAMLTLMDKKLSDGFKVISTTFNEIEDKLINHSKKSKSKSKASRLEKTDFKTIQSPVFGHVLKSFEQGNIAYFHEIEEELKQLKALREETSENQEALEAQQEKVSQKLDSRFLSEQAKEVVHKLKQMVEEYKSERLKIVFYALQKTSWRVLEEMDKVASSEKHKAEIQKCVTLRRNYCDRIQSCMPFVMEALKEAILVENNLLPVPSECVAVENPQADDISEQKTYANACSVSNPHPVNTSLASDLEAAQQTVEKQEEILLLRNTKIEDLQKRLAVLQQELENTRESLTNSELQNSQLRAELQTFTDKETKEQNRFSRLQTQNDEIKGQGMKVEKLLNSIVEEMKHGKVAQLELCGLINTVVTQRFNVAPAFHAPGVNYSQTPHTGAFDANGNAVNFNHNHTPPQQAPVGFYTQPYHRDMVMIPNSNASTNGAQFSQNNGTQPNGPSHSTEYPAGNYEHSPKESKFNPAAKAFNVVKPVAGDQFQMHVKKWD